MAVPLARALGLRVLVTGNARAKDQFVAMGVERYLDYKQENYWEQLSGLDGVIDTLGPAEFDHELAVLRKGGRLVSLRTGPNKVFAQRHQFPGWKKQLFALAGRKYDKAAQKQGKEYRFVFVRSDGAQLRKITGIVEQQQIRPVDSHLMEPEERGKCIGQRIHGKKGRHDLLEPDLPRPINRIGKYEQSICHDQRGIEVIILILDKHRKQRPQYRRVAENTALPGRLDHAYTAHQLKCGNSRQQRQGGQCPYQAAEG